MKNLTLSEIEILVEKFENKSLPKDDWTHDAHLTVGAWYVLNYPIEKAIEMIRNNIKSYNESIGGKNTETSGYHETITLFYMFEMDTFFNFKTFDNLQTAFQLFYNCEITIKEYPFRFYSSTLLSSKNARMNWIEPDLKLLSKNTYLTEESNI